MPVRALEAQGRDLRAAQADRGQRAQPVVGIRPHRVRGLDRREQPLRFVGHRRKVPPPPGEPQTQDGAHDLEVPEPVRGHGVGCLGGEGEPPFGLLQRTMIEVAGRQEEGEFRVSRGDGRGEADEKFLHRADPPVEVQLDPVIREQAHGQVPVSRRLSVPHRLDRVSVRGVPAGGLAVQGEHLRGPGTPQLELEEIGEQAVIAEPVALRIDREHEGPGLLEAEQDPFSAGTSGQQIGKLAVDPTQHRGPQQQRSDRFRLLLQNLRQQVVGHRAFAAGEFRGETLRIRVTGQRERGQPQSGRPTFGSSLQQADGVLGQVHTRRRE